MPSLARLATLFSESCVLHARLQAAGVCPVDCQKCLHRCAWSVNPHRSAMSLKGASVCSIYLAASSRRRRITKVCGDCPKVRLKEREKCASLRRGDYLDARLACSSALELVERELLSHPGQACMLHALLGGIAYEFDEIVPAVDRVERAMGSMSECSHADAVIVAYLTQARLQRLRGDNSSALAILREGQELGQRRGLPRVTFPLAAEECTDLARAIRYEEARLVAARFGFNKLPTPGGTSGLSADKALRAASRYLLRQSPKEVVQALNGAIESSQRRGLAHRSVELLLIRAQAHKQAGEVASALTDLHQALTLAAPRQYLRVFLDEGPELGSLIDGLDLERLGNSPAVPLARRLQQARGKPGNQGRSTGSSLGEQLTRREVSILKRLDSGLSNKEIAEAIFLSEGTLKWHLHNVYSKLNVKNRSGAMARARTLGIV